MQKLGLDEVLFYRGFKFRSEIPTPTKGPLWTKASAWKQLIRSSPTIAINLRRINFQIKSYRLSQKHNYIFHGTNFELPRFSGKSVVTIHDLSPFLWPDHHPPERVRYMQSAICHTLKNATAIITDTQHTKHELASYFSYPLEHIHAVPLANGMEFRPQLNEDLTAVLCELGIQPNEYVLFTGTLEPRKNLSVLLDAYKSLPFSIRKRWPLVIAGHQGWLSDALHASIKTAEQQGWLKYLGFVPQHTLPALMAGARLFVYPSLYEGFGLPILEAMASGTPVICSNASTLPEVAGTAAAFHDPYDVDQLASLLQMGLEDNEWRHLTRAAGLKRAKEFSWQRCAQQTFEVYETIM
jgi:alpha-1,3-rhamnosyl/mannosyltransferase